MNQTRLIDAAVGLVKYVLASWPRTWRLVVLAYPALGVVLLLRLR
jgi:hypothetical protein